MILTAVLSVLIGLLLGLLGGGGSILTVPMLVYCLNVEPKDAVVISFIVVGASSVLALIPHAGRRSVCWMSGVVFGLTGMLGAFAGAHFAGKFSGDVLMAMFGSVCLIAGIVMMGRSRPLSDTTQFAMRTCPRQVPFPQILYYGFFVGGLTGMIGVGGGFLIVPVLTLLVGLPIQGAIGTSLLVIAMNAAAGFIGYDRGGGMDLHLTAVVAGSALAGSALGASLGAYLNAKWLRRAFGVMVVSVACYVLYHSLQVVVLKDMADWEQDTARWQWGLDCLLVFWLCLHISRAVRKTVGQTGSVSPALPSDR